MAITSAPSIRMELYFVDLYAEATGKVHEPAVAQSPTSRSCGYWQMICKPYVLEYIMCTNVAWTGIDHS
jgi:hypothetical protein